MMSWRMKMLTQSNKVTAIVMPTGLDVPPVLWITGSLGQATKLVSFHRSFKMRNGWTRSLGWLCAAALLIYDSLLWYPEKGSKQRVPPLQVRRYIGPELSWIPIVVNLFGIPGLPSTSCLKTVQITSTLSEHPLQAVRTGGWGQYSDPFP